MVSNEEYPLPLELHCACVFLVDESVFWLQSGFVGYYVKPFVQGL